MQHFSGLTMPAAEQRPPYPISRDIYNVTPARTFHIAVLPHTSRKILPAAGMRKQETSRFHIRSHLLSRQAQIIYTERQNYYRYNAPRNTASPVLVFRSPAILRETRNKQAHKNPSKYLTFTQHLPPPFAMRANVQRALPAREELVPMINC